MSPVNPSVAQCMVLLAVLSVPIQFVSIAELFTTITLVENQSAYYQALSVTQREAMVMASLDAHHYGMHVGQIFWGLWLLPFGLLVHKSRFLPSFLGFFLILGGIGYLAQFVGKTCWTDFGNSIIGQALSIPKLIGEFGICLWMLIRGDLGAFRKG